MNAEHLSDADRDAAALGAVVQFGVDPWAEVETRLALAAGRLRAHEPGEALIHVGWAAAYLRLLAPGDAA